MVSGQKSQIRVGVVDDPAAAIVEQIALEDALDDDCVAARVCARTRARTGSEGREYLADCGFSERRRQEAALALEQRTQLGKRRPVSGTHAATASNARAAAAIVRSICSSVCAARKPRLEL